MFFTNTIFYYLFFAINLLEWEFLSTLRATFNIKPGWIIL